MLTYADKKMVIALLLAALLGVGLNMYYLSANRQGQSSAVISVDGKVVKTIRLQPGYSGEFKIGDNSGFNIIEYKDGRVRIREADCHDQICVQTGWISTPPQQIVCLPYKVVVKVISDRPAEVDDIVR
ncbi:NusG domain II-containing protein [Sporomusa aerivorans]|uniref:NusG domain II-containing protein n=1 Tax=Sporomusa aerivorans TaxID=204936 RepID=UPI003529DDE2